MDIAALSTAIKTDNLSLKLGIAIEKKVIDTTSENSMNMVKMLAQSISLT